MVRGCAHLAGGLTSEHLTHPDYLPLISSKVIFILFSFPLFRRTNLLVLSEESLHTLPHQAPHPGLVWMRALSPYLFEETMTESHTPSLEAGERPTEKTWGALFTSIDFKPDRARKIGRNEDPGGSGSLGALAKGPIGGRISSERCPFSLCSHL